MKISFYFTTALLCLFCSCKKDKPADKDTAPIYIHFSAEALTYVMLPLNKYFIYKDSATGTTDSVVVTMSKIDEYLQPAFSGSNPNDIFGFRSPAYYYQIFSLLLTKFDGTAQQDWLYAVAASSPTGFFVLSSDTATVDLLEKDRATNINRNSIFLFPSNTIYPPQESVPIIPSIIVEGKSYSNVIAYSSENMYDSTNANYLRSTYYWAKNLGIIKRVLQTSNSIKTELLLRNG